MTIRSGRLTADGMGCQWPILAASVAVPTTSGRANARLLTGAMSSPLLTFYTGWDRYNDLLERAISGLDAHQLSLRAAPHLGSVRMLANHIVAVRAWWFQSWMGEGGTQLAEFVDYDEGQEADRRAAPAIVSALRTTWSSLASSLSTWTEDDLARQFQRPEPNAAGERPWRTRQWIIWHVAEHDLHHGGEISLTLGMHGLVGVGV